AVGIVGVNLLNQTNSSSAATMFITLRSFEERTRQPNQSGLAILGKLAAQYSQEQDGMVLLFPPPPVRGIGFAGGFKMQVQDRAGQSSPQELQKVLTDLSVAASKDPHIAQAVSS